MIVCKFQNSMNTAVTSYMASVRFVKHLVKVSLVNIVYHRVNVNPNDYEVRSVKEYKYMACKPNSEDPIAVSIYYAAKGVAHAIENKYLREMYLIFKNKKSGEVFEYYKFSFTYQEKPECTTLPKSEDVIKASIEFMKHIEMLGSYGKLPSNLDVVVEISFFKDTTPKDYNPPHFRKHIDSVPLIQQLPDFMSPPIRVGYVNTGYHKIKCRATGQCFNDTPFSTPRHTQSNRRLVINDESEEKENGTPEDVPSEQLDNNKENEIQDVIDIDDSDHQGHNKENEILHNVNDLNQPKNYEVQENIKKSICTISDMSDVIADLNADVLNSNPRKYLCPCKINEEINGIQTIVCSICLHQQHTACVGFEKAVLAPDPYVCIYCRRENRPATDKILLDIKPPCWQDIAALRLGLIKCKKSKGSNQGVQEALNYLPKKIQYRVCEMLKKTKVVEKGENENIKFSYQMAEAVALRVFNAVAVPDSLQLCDEEDDTTTEKKRVTRSKNKSNEQFTETSSEAKRKRYALRF